MFRKAGLAQVQRPFLVESGVTELSGGTEGEERDKLPFLAEDSYLVLSKTFRKNPACLQSCRLRSCSVGRLVRDKEMLVLWLPCKGSA